MIEYIATASILQRSGDLTRAMKAVEYASQMMPESQDARFALPTLRSNQMLPKPARPKGRHRPGAHGQREILGQEDEDGQKKADPVEEARQKAMVLLAGLLFDQGDEVSDNPTARRGLGALTRGDTGTLRAGHDRSRIVLHVGQAIDSLTQNDESQASKELERALDLGLRNPTAYFILGLLQQGRDNDRSLRYLQEAQRHPDYDLASNLLIGQM